MNIKRTLGRNVRRVIRASAALAVLFAISPVRAAAPLGAADSVVVIVSAASPVTQISRLHLADLYLGRTTRFPGGTAATPMEQKAGSAARVEFLANYLGRTEAQMKSHWSKLIFTGRGRPPQEASTAQAMRELVARSPHAIGYLEARLVDASVRTVRVE